MLDNLIGETPDSHRSLKSQGIQPKLAPAFDPKQIKTYFFINE